MDTVCGRDVVGGRAQRGRAQESTLGNENTASKTLSIVLSLKPLLIFKKFIDEGWTTQPPWGSHRLWIQAGGLGSWRPGHMCCIGRAGRLLGQHEHAAPVGRRWSRVYRPSNQLEMPLSVCGLNTTRCPPACSHGRLPVGGARVGT